jgi:hypothetical protein
MTKRCPRCEQTKPIDGGFYVRKNGQPTGWCRECWRADRRDYTRSEQGRARAAEYAREYQVKNPERVRAAKSRSDQRHPDHVAAREAANYAIRTGRIVRPATCEQCGTDPGHDRLGRTRLRADHFAGYAREHWLTVRFLCPTCDGLQIRAANDARRATP